jgi:hypothetical protein
MSYDLHLLRLSGSADALAEAQAIVSKEEEEINPGPPVPEKEERKQNLAKLLIQENPSLERFQFGFAEIAKTYNWTDAEARTRFRHIELNGPDGSNGIQITLYDDKADITVPYWHQPEAAHSVFAEIWRYLEVLVHNGKFAVYDPQLDRLLNLASDQPEVLRRYGGVVAKVPDMIKDAEKRKRPWWKFW